MKINPTKDARFFLAIGIVVVALWAFFCWHFVLSTPQFALWRMYQAVQRHDYETFTKYFDFDSVFDDAFSRITETMGKTTDKKSSDDLWSGLGESLAQGFITMMAPSLKEGLRSEIKRQVELGTFQAGKRPADLITIFTKLRVKREGKIAEISYKTELGETTAVKMRQKGGSWQVISIGLDLPSLGSEIGNQTTPEEKKVVFEKKIGEVVELATLTFMVNSAEEKQTLNSRYSPQIVAKGGAKFVVVDMNILNTTKSGFTFFPDDGLLLVDNEDREFKTYSDSIGSIDNYLNVRELTPGIEEQGYLVYEIPEDAQSYSLVTSKKDTNEVYKVRLK